MKLLRINMETGKIEFERLREHWLPIGGSALLARIMNREVPPAADPLGPKNAFIIAVGPLAGTGAPQLGRISVGAKSPLTLGIKEANAGGPAGQLLDRLGIRAIIVHGAPQDDRLTCLLISEDLVDLIPAEKYRGLKNYELAGQLRKKYGEKAAVISTGPAGERKYRGASVSFTDLFGDPSRNAARGGSGP
jgi:aldehyde:ferredoxin oxidoreductase